MSAPKLEHFTVSVDDKVIEDLKKRLALTRWPDEIPDSAWQYGSSLAYLKELVEYWLNDYDWSRAEELLNGFPQYMVSHEKVDLHFIHVPGKGPEPLPLIISHGWPGSIYEFVKVIGPLTDPAAHGGDPKDAFSLVAPSLPGYGFSSLANRARLGIDEMVDVFAWLMDDVLGYSNFVAQGGDWGALVATGLGLNHPDKTTGIHINMMAATPDRSDITNLSEDEQKFIQEATSFQDGIGYQWIQGTKPQTLAFGLNDSPAGLAAWITEKFHAWTDCDGNIENSVSKDDLLSNIMIYWVTQTINSSFWPYYQMRHEPLRLKAGEKITVPTAFAAFPGEIFTPPEEWVARAYNLKRYTTMDHGGHFAALEEPEMLVEDMREFFRGMR
ncbi:MAG: epoxide hydrolase family protein [Candidatus Adiutricales bacterium]